MSDKYKTKPQHRGYQTAIEAVCIYCGKMFWESKCSYLRKKRHFCSRLCYSKFRTELQPIEAHPRWQGGVSHTEAHRRWKAKNPERMAHLKARRYARERGASGAHSLAEWEWLKKHHDYRCAVCGQDRPLTKDHIIPLSLGGSDNISNIQPLCRNCNSQKWAKLPARENPDLINNVKG